jgi:hypothetical protein
MKGYACGKPVLLAALSRTLFAVINYMLCSISYDIPHFVSAGSSKCGTAEQEVPSLFLVKR